MNTKPITETILAQCDGSTTELARRLTVSSDKYYTPNMVTHWCRTQKVPPEHASIVAKTFDLPIEDVAPYMFTAHHNNKR